MRFEYSPESFTGTELDFAAEVVDAVVAEWAPGDGEKVIVNLPSTVELTTPNRYADQIEWMHRHLASRERIILSVHTHNDRGCAVAATELALLAGAERVEGTLFGNGERTGNVDLVTVALNLYTQGVDPGLNLSDLPALVEVFEHCNRLPVPARHPYAGALVFTAFSGSHQDAIKKGLEARERERNPYWEVPYLPVDPSDLGREHENFIRINSQSGKGGVAFVMENSYGYVLPRGLAIEFSRVVQRITDGTGEELAPAALLRAFTGTYLEPGRLELAAFETERRGKDACTVRATITDQGQEREVAGTGNGPIDAFVRGLRQTLGLDFRFHDYHEHALGDGADARALAYVQLRDGAGQPVFGVGQDPDIVAASLQAVLHGAARILGEMDEAGGQLRVVQPHHAAGAARAPAGTRSQRKAGTRSSARTGSGRSRQPRLQPSQPSTWAADTPRWASRASPHGPVPLAQPGPRPGRSPGPGGRRPAGAGPGPPGPGPGWR